ncbi:hypothetical protein NMY22_g10072 [Coprinellus aureogranulatus]|nr:hypothetical protein NMY22_g10072 [Coprinellus aureogranulatus]
MGLRFERNPQTMKNGVAVPLFRGGNKATVGRACISRSNVTLWDRDLQWTVTSIGDHTLGRKADGRMFRDTNVAVQKRPFFCSYLRACSSRAVCEPSAPSFKATHSFRAEAVMATLQQRPSSHFAVSATNFNHESHFYRRGIPSSSPYQSRAPTPPPPPNFDSVVEIIRNVEYARRLLQADPRNSRKQASFRQATAQIDWVYEEYKAGHLDANTCSMIDLFFGIWYWDADLSDCEIPLEIDSMGSLSSTLISGMTPLKTTYQRLPHDGELDQFHHPPQYPLSLSFVQAPLVICSNGWPVYYLCITLWIAFV